MITIYDLLEVKENASKEEIEKSYQNLILEYQINPILSEKENKENEMILNKLKIAYEILTNDEKRKKYDKDLANKRAEELLKNVSTTPQKEEIETNNQEEDKSFYDEDDDSEEYVNLDKTDSEDEEIDEVVLSKKDQNNVKKAAKRDFKENLKKAQKIEEEYNQAYNKAYNDYLRKMGYKVKEPVTLRKILTTVITIVVIIVVGFILWKIPPIHRILVNIYEENFIIKSLVDIVKIFFEAIFGIFK